MFHLDARLRVVANGVASGRPVRAPPHSPPVRIYTSRVSGEVASAGNPLLGLFLFRHHRWPRRFALGRLRGAVRRGRNDRAGQDPCIAILHRHPADSLLQVGAIDSRMTSHVF